MAFWGQAMDSNIRDPKRKFRFKVEIEGLGNGIVWYAKTVSKPSMTISGDAEHKFLGHTFKFPGSVTWEDVELTLVDPAEEIEDAATKLLNIVQGSGYQFPRDIPVSPEQLRTISKGKAVEALQKFVIYQLDGEGRTVEKWTLHNAFVISLNFNGLDYGSDDLSEINMTVKYDWAEFSNGRGDDSQYFEPPSAS